MFVKFFLLVVIAVYQVNAQATGTAADVSCGKVDIPPMTPAQAYNFWLWGYPGWIAASNCYTGYLHGSYQALTELYNQMYLAGPPAPASPAPAPPANNNQ